MLLLRMIPEMNSIRQNGNLGRIVRSLRAVAFIDVERGVRWNVQVSALAEFQPL
jgi:hypothetical protein